MSIILLTTVELLCRIKYDFRTTYDHLKGSLWVMLACAVM